MMSLVGVYGFASLTMILDLQRQLIDLYILCDKVFCGKAGFIPAFDDGLPRKPLFQSWSLAGSWLLFVWTDGEVPSSASVPHLPPSSFAQKR